METRWYHFIAYFFGGAFLANTIPHLVNGISGSPFQSPFASPPGEGLSSSVVNVLWGMFNFVGLFAGDPSWSIRSAADEACGCPGAQGILVMAIMLARAFGRLHGGNF